MNKLKHEQESWFNMGTVNRWFISHDDQFKEYHRIGRPAIIYTYPTKTIFEYWWLFGRQYTESDY